MSWLRCRKCMQLDITKGPHIGTKTVMRCPDCAEEGSPYATLCRKCCPTEHGTTGTDFIDFDTTKPSTERKRA